MSGGNGRGSIFKTKRETIRELKKELENQGTIISEGAKQTAEQHITAVEEYIRLVQSKTRLKDALRKVLDEVPGACEMAEDLLKEIE